MSCNCINNKPCNPDDNQKPQGSTQVINNIVYNQADNEDLEEVIQDGKSVLHFKDKLYNPEEYSGYGRVWLRKNIKKSSLCDCCDDTKKNILTQNMFFKQDNISPNTNTIYIVQYDYDLDGNTITIPSDSVLVFDGGSFSNGQIILDNTLVVPPTLDLNDVLKNITIGGTYKEGQTIYKDKYLQYWDGKKWCKLEDGSQYIKSIRLNGNTTTSDSNGNADLGTLTIRYNNKQYTPENNIFDLGNLTILTRDKDGNATQHTSNPSTPSTIDLGALNVTFRIGNNSVVYNIADGATIDLTNLINRYVENALLWKRTGTTLSPKTDGDNISTSGKVYQGV